MGLTKENKLIKQLAGKQEVQKQTPIATEMFLPNHSGIAVHPEFEKAIAAIPTPTLAQVTASGKVTTTDITAKYFLSNNSDYGIYGSHKNAHVAQNAYYDGGWKSYGSAASYGTPILFQTNGEGGTALRILTGGSPTAANEVLSFTAILDIDTNGNIITLTGGNAVVGSNSLETAGAIRFDGSNFYGYNGMSWVQLDNI